MPKRRLSLIAIAALGLAFFTGTLAAQAEKITLKTVPAPNQVIRIGMIQNMNFDAETAALPAPMKIEGVTALQGTQRVGSPDSAGRITAVFTVDSLTMGMTVNGSPLPGPPLDFARRQEFHHHLRCER